MNSFTKPITDGSRHRCFVGNGECNIPATHWFETHCPPPEPAIEYCCAHHAEEVEAFAETIRKLTPEKFQRLEEVTAAATKEQNGLS